MDKADWNQQGTNLTSKTWTGEDATVWDKVTRGQSQVKVNLGVVPNIHEACYALCKCY
jgi:hypothetical protein